MKPTKTSPDLTKFLKGIEFKPDHWLLPTDLDEISSAIKFLRSLGSDLIGVINRHDPWDQPLFKFIKLLLLDNSLQSLTPEKAEHLINSLEPLSEETRSKINYLCNFIFPLDSSSRINLGNILSRFIPDSPSSKSDSFLAAQKLESPDWFTGKNRHGDIAIARISSVILSNFKKRYKGQELLNKIMSLNIFFLRAQINYEIKSIQTLQQTPKAKQTAVLLKKAFSIGKNYGLISSLNTLRDPFFQKYIFEAVSATKILKTRYKEKEALYLEAITKIVDLWEKGDTRWHHEMARDFVKEERFFTLSRVELQKRLLPFAQYYKKDYQGEHMKKRKR